MKKCTECRGYGKIYCPVCKGNSYGSEKKCTYCNNTGLMTCNFCAGSGWTDDNGL